MAKGENRMIRRRLANAYLSSVVSISLVLLLVGVASLLLVNTDNVSDYFKENMKVSVLMMPEVSDAQAMDYQAVLDSMPFIRGTEFISRAQGEQEMARMLGKDFLSVFETSPIPVSVDVTLAADYVSDDSLKVVSQRLSASPLVDEVVWQKSLVDALGANLARISMVLGIFIVLLLFISFVLIGNTMRLSVYARRFTIHTMKMVGATKNFIRGPFLLNSALLGLFSSLVAILLLVGLLFLLRGRLSFSFLSGLFFSFLLSFCLSLCLGFRLGFCLSLCLGLLSGLFGFLFLYRNSFFFIFDIEDDGV